MKVDFKTNNGEFSFVKVSDLACYINPLNGVCYIETKDDSIIKIDTDNKKVEWSNFVKDLTEKDWEQVVDMELGRENTGCFVDYTKGKNYLGYWSHFTFITATESGKSLMNSLEVYLENPYGEHKPSLTEDLDFKTTKASEFLIEQMKWNKVQERTGNWILIKYK